MSTPNPVFPGSIATDAQLKVANNLIQTTLSVAVTGTNTILFVASTAGFRANCLVSVENEIMAVDSVVASPNPQLIVNPAGRGFDGDHIVTDRGEPSGVAAGARPDVECNEIRAARDKRHQCAMHGVGWHGLKTRRPNGGLRIV